MERESSIDFDCEYYLQRVVNEGDLDTDRRTTKSVIYHLCTFHGDAEEHRCNVKKCPKRKKTAN